MKKFLFRAKAAKFAKENSAGQINDAQVEAAAPAVPVTEAAPAPVPAPALPPEEVDAELLAIFLEEADEVMGTIGEHLKLVTAEPIPDDNVIDLIEALKKSLKAKGGAAPAKRKAR